MGDGGNLRLHLGNSTTDVPDSRKVNLLLPRGTHSRSDGSSKRSF